MKYLLQQYREESWEEVMETDTVLGVLFYLKALPMKEMLEGKYRILSDMDARYPVSKEDFENDKRA